MSSQGRCSEFRAAGSGEALVDVARVDVFKRFLIGAAGVGAVSASLYVASGIAGLAGLGFALIILAVAVIDWRLLVISDELSALAVVLGIGAVGFERSDDAPAGEICARNGGGFVSPGVGGMKAFFRGERAPRQVLLKASGEICRPIIALQLTIQPSWEGGRLFPPRAPAQHYLRVVPRTLHGTRKL